jgi:hypothetical protein
VNGSVASSTSEQVEHNKISDARGGKRCKWGKLIPNLRTSSWGLRQRMPR